VRSAVRTSDNVLDSEYPPRISDGLAMRGSCFQRFLPERLTEISTLSRIKWIS